MSTFRPSFSPQSKVYPQPFDSCNPCAPKSPFVFNRLRTLYLSCRSFCDSCPLFSMTSALFDKNTGGRVPRSGLWTLGGSRRRLPVPETQPRDTRANIPSSPSASTALIIPTGSKGFNTLWVRFPSSPLPHLRPLLRSPPLCVSTFRINTYKSVSKQRTLTIFRINTCEKPRGRGVPLAGRRDDSITSQRQCGTGGDWSGRRRRAGAPGAGRRLSGLGKIRASWRR